MSFKWRRGLRRVLNGGPTINGDRLVHDYVADAGVGARLPKGIRIWDETLRDGEQTPGVAFTPDEKLEIARLLDDIGVHMIDVGIPVVSKEEARAVKAIANAGLDATIIAAARAVRKDVEACIACDVDEVALFIACSYLHLKYKLKMTREEVLEAAVRETEYAVGHGVRVSFVTEDTFRADMDFAVQLHNACTDAGATRAVVCDTVGVMTPSAIAWFFERIKPKLKPVELSFHGHNDFGLAVANSLAACEAGVQVPHATVNGLGERSGNASLEELVMTLDSLYSYDTGIDASRLYELSRLVERLSGVPVGVSKPIVGYNAFSHESGIHADGMIKHTATYEPIQPERVGRRRQFIFGKHTGSTAVEEKLRQHGVEASREEVARLVERVKELAEGRSKEEVRRFIDGYREREERRRGISDEEFWVLARQVGITVPRKKAT